MSEIDKRVVQMVFDNEDFEKNIEKSRKSLEKMDSSINKIAKNTNSKNLGNVIDAGVEHAVSNATLKVEAFRSVINTVMTTITNSVMATLSKIQGAVNNLTFDNIGVGFGKYEEKLTSVQTIMNATGKSIQVVEQEMAKLNWYTDETSYNFSDMANNIGKFTAVGVELETASSAMQGIANWAALAGQNAQSASRAMYNMAQALSAGYVKQQDWASIQNANMDTQELRKTVFETAREMAKAGKYTALSAEWFDTHTANDFFADLGKNKNFTTDVLLETLQKFSSYSDEVHRISEETGWTTSEVMDSLEKVTKEEVESLEAIVDPLNITSDQIAAKAKELGVSYEEALEHMGVGTTELKKKAEELGITLETAINVGNIGAVAWDLGERAFKAGQEYKTFKDVIDATNDAASTVWMNIYQQIFGNYLQAKEFWTELGGIFYDTFVGPVEYIRDILISWNEFSGRNLLIGVGEDASSVFTELYDAISSVVDVVKQAFLEMNPFISTIEKGADGVDRFVVDTEKLGVALAYYTKELRDWISLHKLSEKQLGEVRKVAKGFFVVLKNIGKILYSVGRSALVIWEALLPSFDTVIKVLKSAEENSETVDSKFNDIANTIWRVANVIAGIIKGFKRAVMNGEVVEYLSALAEYLLSFASNYIRAAFDSAKKETDGIVGFIKGTVTLIINILKSLGKAFANVFQPVFQTVSQIITNFVNSGIGSQILSFLSSVATLLQNTFILTLNLLNGFVNLLNTVMAYLNEFFTNTLGANDQQASAGAMATILGVIVLIISYIMDAIKEGKMLERMQAMNDLFDSISKAIDGFTNAVNAVALKEIGKGIALIAVAMLMVASIPREKLGATLKMVAGILVTFIGSLAIIASLSSQNVGASGIVGLIKSFQQLAISMLIMASIILKLMKIKPDELFAGLFALNGIFAAVVLFMGGLNVALRSGSNQSVEMYKAQIAGMTTLIKSTVWLAVIINVLKSTILSIGNLETGSFVQGLIGMAGIVLILFWFEQEVIKSVKIFGNKESSTASFTKIVMSLSAAFAVIAIAINLLSVPLLALGGVSSMSADIVARGVTYIIILMLIVTRLMSSLQKNAKLLAVTSNGPSIIMSLAGAILIMAIAINAMMLPIMIFALMPVDNLVRGIIAFGVVGGLILLLLLTVRGISGIGANTSRLANNGLPIWLETLKELTKNLLSLALALTAFMIPLAILDYLIQNGMDVNAVIWAMIKYMGAILGFTAVASLISAIPFVNASMFEIGLGFLLLGTSLMFISFAIKTLANTIEILAQELSEDNISTNVGKLWEAFKSAIMVLSIVGGIIAAIVKLNGSKTTTVLGGLLGKNGKKKTTTGSMSIGQEIMSLGAGLLMISLALTSLVAPIMVLGNMDPDIYKTGSERLGVLLIAFGVFLGVVMAMFGVMAHFSPNATGWSHTTESTDSGIKAFFKGGRKRVSKKQATSFGANMEEIAKAMLIFAGAITLLTAPIKLMGMIDKDEWNQGFTSVILVLTIIAVMVLAFGALYGKEWDTKKMNKLVLVITTVIIGVVAIIGVMRWLADYLKDEVNRTMFREARDSFLYIAMAISALMFLFAALGKLGLLNGSSNATQQVKPSKTKELLATTALIAAICGGFLVVVIALEKLMNSSWDDTWPVKLGVLGGILVVLIGTFYGLLPALLKPDKIAKLNVLSISFAIISGSLLLIASSLAILAQAKVSVGQIIAFLSTIAVVFTGLGVVTQFTVAGDLFVTAVAFAAVSVALLLIASSLAILAQAKVDADQITSFILTIIVLFAGLALVTQFTTAGDMIITAAAFAILAASMNLIATSLVILSEAAANSKNGWADIWSGAAALGVVALVGMVVVAVFGLLVDSISAAAVGIVIAAACFALVSLSCLAFAASIYLITQALIDLGENWDVVETGLDNITTWLLEHEDEWMQIVDDILELAEKHLESSIGTMTGMIGVLGASIGSVGIAFAQLITDVDTISAAGITKDDDLLTASGKLRDYVLGERASYYHGSGSKEYYEKQQESDARLLNQYIETFRKERGHGRIETDDIISGIQKFTDIITKRDGGILEDDLNKIFIKAAETNDNWNWVRYNYDNVDFMQVALSTPGARIYNAKNGWQEGRVYGPQLPKDELTTEELNELRFGYKTKEEYYKALVEAGEDVGSGAGITGEGVDLLNDNLETTNSELNKNASYLAAQQYASDQKQRMEDIERRNQLRSQTTRTDEEQKEYDALVAKARQTSPKLGEESGVLFGAGFTNGLWSFFSNNGDIKKTFWSWFGLDESSEVGEKIFGGIEKGATGVNDTLKAVGIDVKWGEKLNEAVDGIASLIGIDTTSEDYKTMKSNLNWNNIKSKGKGVINDFIKGVTVDGKDPGQALSDALSYNGVTGEGLENNVIKDIVLKGLGLDGIVGGEELDFSTIMKDFKMEDVLNVDPEKITNEVLSGFGLGDAGEEAGSQYAAGVYSGANAAFPTYNYDDVLKNYGFNTEDFYNTGYDLGDAQGLGQIDGYKDQIANIQDAYTFDKSTYDISDYTSGSLSKASDLVWRGWSETEHKDLYAPTMEDFVQTLVKPIRDGFEWMGWGDTSEGVWKPVADALKDTTDEALANKVFMTDSQNQKWMRDDTLGKWVAIDSNGKPIMKEGMNGESEMWTADIQKVAPDVKNGVWVWNAQNKEWMLMVDGDYATDQKGFMITSSAGIDETPTLSAEMSAYYKKQAQDEYEKQLKLYGDLDTEDQSVKHFTSDGKNLKFQTKAETVVDEETGKAKKVSKKYDLYGRKLSGMENAFVLVDKNGNVIVDANGNRKAFQVSKSYRAGKTLADGTVQMEEIETIKDISYLLNETANTTKEAAQSAEQTAKDTTTAAALNGTATAVQNAESTKNVYTTGTVQTSDLNLVKAKSNNDVGAVTHVNDQSAQDATQSAKSAIDHLSDISTKLDTMMALMQESRDAATSMNEAVVTYLPGISTGVNTEAPVILDTGKVVGAITPMLNKSLGFLSRYGSRGVTT